MKRFKYYIASALILAGCDGKLDLTNPNAPTTATYWKTADQAFAGITGVYNALTVDGTYMRTFPSFSDSRGDDFKGDSPATYLELAGKFSIPVTANEVQWIWRDFYSLIFRANQVIEYVGNMENGILDQESKDRILGQAYFLRGLAYYNLALTFKAVPVIIEVPKTQENYYPATASEETLWNQIFTDLETAEGLLPLSYDNVNGPDKGQKGRATKGAAAGLLGKAYLYKKDYQKAATQFEKFFFGPLKGIYRLMSDYRDNFKSSKETENNAESLFEVQFSTEGGSVNNWAGEPNANWRQFSGLSVAYAMDGKGWSDYLPTRWIYNEFKIEKTTDGKSDPRLLATIASYEPADNSVNAYGMPWSFAQNAIYPRKYTNDGLGATTDSAPELTGGINYRVLRYADILLMYAEVLNELGRTNEAYPYIQQVRTRAKLPDLAVVKPGMNQVQMRDQIAHERALEFAIEGQRIQDIIRWGWLYDADKLAMLKEHDSDFETWRAGKEYLPIPQSELNANKNLAPNPAN